MRAAEAAGHHKLAEVVYVEERPRPTPSSNPYFPTRCMPKDSGAPRRKDQGLRRLVLSSSSSNISLPAAAY
uniref:Uncharacterized protein n=1 Tax=Triticum urartu TaxID=4572 RepID=A0A8R7TGK8_TRIUA